MRSGAAGRRKRANGKRSGAWIRPGKRWAIYLRDAWTCIWCGCALQPGEGNLDHLFPRGHLCRDNHERRIVTACVTCNTSRKAQRIGDWLRILKDRGVLLSGVLARLRGVRYGTLDRAAGQAAREAYRASLCGPLALEYDPFELFPEGIPV